MAQDAHWRRVFNIVDPLIYPPIQGCTKPRRMPACIRAVEDPLADKRQGFCEFHAGDGGLSEGRVRGGIISVIQPVIADILIDWRCRATIAWPGSAKKCASLVTFGIHTHGGTRSLIDGGIDRILPTGRYIIHEPHHHLLQRCESALESVQAPIVDLQHTVTLTADDDHIGIGIGLSTVV